MSWKLVGAALKAQRTWANLSPEQKEQVTRAAARAARNAYARMQDPSSQPAPPAQQAPPAGAAQAPPAATGAATPAQPAAAPSEAPRAQPEPPPAAAPDASGEARGDSGAAPSTAEALLALARTQGPRLAQHAASVASTRTQKRAAQLAALWRRTQQRPPT